MIGATQKSQSWLSAQPPTNSAGPVLRAGLTDVFVTGIETRWISASASPMASGAPGFDLAKGFAANGYAEHSPGKYSLGAAALTEFVMTAVFLFVIMGATHGKAPAGFAPLAIGLALTLIHLVSIPVTNTSVNPARSTGPALFVGGWAISQLWLFWVAPLLGGAAGAIAYRWLSEEPAAAVTGTTRPV